MRRSRSRSPATTGRDCGDHAGVKPSQDRSYGHDERDEHELPCLDTKSIAITRGITQIVYQVAVAARVLLGL